MYKSIFKDLNINTNDKKYKRLQPPKTKDDKYLILSNKIYQCDLITMPAFNGFNYILNVVNMRDKYSDVRTLKNKYNDTVLKAFKSIIQGDICNNIELLYCDQGSEFTNKLFKSFCDDNNITLVFTRVGNHKQAGIIEASNRHYKKILNEYMSYKTNDEYFLNWPSVLFQVRDGINNYKKEHPRPLWDFMKSSYTAGDNFKFKIGEKVHIMLDYPKTLLNNKRMHSGHGSGFRSGDKRFSDEIYTVIGYSLVPEKQIRYKVESLNKKIPYGNYLSNQLIKA